MDWKNYQATYTVYEKVELKVVEFGNNFPSSGTLEGMQTTE